MVFVKSKKLIVKGSSRGFTLVEMLVAFGIFSVIMVISVGSLVSLIEANSKAQKLKAVVNNLHFALENMSRNIRTGHTYHCGADGALEEPRDCAETSANSLAFMARTGANMLYRHNVAAGTIERSDDGGASYVPITAPEVTVERLNFYVDGACPASNPGPNPIDDCPATDDEQPRVLIVVNGVMQSRGTMASTTRFDVETLVSQRQLDI